MAVRQDYISSGNMLFNYWKQRAHLFVAYGVKHRNLRGATVDAKHPPDLVAFAMDFVLAMIDFALVNLHDTWQL